METSATSGQNVQATFTLLCEEILIQKYPKLYNRHSVRLQANEIKEDQNHKKSCC